MKKPLLPLDGVLLLEAVVPHLPPVLILDRNLQNDLHNETRREKKQTDKYKAKERRKRRREVSFCLLLFSANAFSFACCFSSPRSLSLSLGGFLSLSLTVLSSPFLFHFRFLFSFPLLFLLLFSFLLLFFFFLFLLFPHWCYLVEAFDHFGEGRAHRGVRMPTPLNEPPKLRVRLI